MKSFRSLSKRDRESGATAVEFALIVPLLLLLVFGIIDYGLWFSDSLSVRQGVREAARQGVVENFGDSDCTLTGASGSAEELGLLCTAQDRIGGITGDPAVKVLAPAGWVKGEPLIVCAQLLVGVGTGIVPLPNDRIISSKVEMAIENVDPDFAFSGAEESAPSGKNWTWCA